MTKYIYSGFIAVLAFAGVMLAYYLFTNDYHVWHTFYLAYLASAIAYIWYTMLMLAKEDMRPRVLPAYENEGYAVVIPCYNEQPDLLVATVRTAYEAAGRKYIVIVDDGNRANLPLMEAFEFVKKHYGAHVIHFTQNKGKREGLRAAIEFVPDHVPYIICTDSDTQFKPDTFTHLVRGLKHENVGAVSGDVRVANHGTNWLTRMVSAYYWSAFNINRRSQSAMGQVACCSGALAGYRTAVVKPLVRALTTQTFLGKKCTYGEDRHLTNLVLEAGHDVIYIPEAVADTDSPTTFKKFLKQQLRWRRGFVQEAVYAMGFMWRVKPVLFAEILLWEIVTPYLGLAVVMLMLIEIAKRPALLLTFIPVLVYISVVRHLPLVFRAPRLVPHMVTFTLFSFFVSYWQSIYALFTVRNKTWATR